tara:strand:+ start:378 stop:2054 length:1677 start_codon:yes stop_codon:yes gene_type:complete
MDSINDMDNNIFMKFDAQSPNLLYISFFGLTFFYLGIKYLLSVSAIKYDEANSKWVIKKRSSNIVSLLYLIFVLISQIAILIFVNLQKLCGNLNSAPMIAAKAGTAWLVIFGITFISINFLFPSWKGPFSNTIGYEISSRIFGVEKHDKIMNKLLNDPSKLGKDVDESLSNLLKNVLDVKNKTSIRHFINGITLDDFAIFINKAIEEKVVKPIKNTITGGKKRRKKRKGGNAADQEAVAGDTALEVEKKAEEEKKEKDANKEAEEQATVEEQLTDQASNIPDAPATEKPEAADTEKPEAPDTEISKAPDAEISKAPDAEIPDASLTEAVAETPAEPDDTTTQDTNTDNANNNEDADNEGDEVDIAEASESLSKNPVYTVIRLLFKAICLKDLISELVWLSLTGSLSILVAYTLFLEQKCKTEPDSVFSGAAKLVKAGDNKSSKEMKKYQRDAKKRQQKLGNQLKDDETYDELVDKGKKGVKSAKKRGRKELFTMLNDDTYKGRTFNKKYKSDEFWLGQQYKSSLELGDYQTNVRANNREIEERIKKQGVPFITQMFKI